MSGNSDDAIKVFKKDERTARAMAWHRLCGINFPSDRIEQKVEASWPAYLKDAIAIRKWYNVLEGSELTGYTTQATLDLYSDED